VPAQHNSEESAWITGEFYLRKSGKANVIHAQVVKGGLCYRVGHFSVSES
jgi:hypothetical protein